MRTLSTTISSLTKTLESLKKPSAAADAVTDILSAAVVFPRRTLDPKEREITTGTLVPSLSGVEYQRNIDKELTLTLPIAKDLLKHSVHNY